MTVLRFALPAMLVAGCATPTPQVAPDSPWAASRSEVRRFDTCPLEGLEEAALNSFLYELRQAVVPSERGAVVIETHGAPIPLTDLGSIDLQWGSGHVFKLVSLRMLLKGETVDLELAEWQGPELGDSEPRVRSLRRMSVPVESVRWLRDHVRVMPMVSCSEQAPDSSWASADFFVLVRAMDSAGKEIMTREFAGYPGDRRVVQYAPIEIVTDMARKLPSEEGWIPIPETDWRNSHVTDAFNRNRGVLLEESHSWVRDYTCYMLSWFGNERALETIRFLRESMPDPRPANLHSLDVLLDPVNELLTGPPKRFSGRE